MTNPAVRNFRQKLEQLTNPGKADWLENYVKHDIKSIGVGIPDIRKTLISESAVQDLRNAELQDQIHFLNALMASEWTEEKLAAIIYMQLYWKDIEIADLLTVIENWFDERLIYDWNVCDWLCVRVLAPTLDKKPESMFLYLQNWNEADYLWKARASLVPYAASKKIFGFKKEIARLTPTLISRPERFSKTAVGWVLRELSRYDMDFVKQFLAHYKEHLTPEVTKNALKYLSEN